MIKLLFSCLFLISIAQAQRCQKLFKCPQVLSAFKVNSVYPTFCNEDENIVVCPPLPKSVEERKCYEYSKAVYQYDRGEDEHKDKCTTSAIPFIVGGGETGVNEFPHQALLGDEREWFCGGSLVSEEFVLTAAHCLLPKPPTRIRLGMHDITAREQTAQDFGVRRTTSHPNYKKPVVYDDIALVQLNRKVQFTPYVRPICLPSRAEGKSIAKLTATGYGRTEYGGLQSKKLQKVEVPKVSTQKCLATYKSYIKELPYGITGGQLCYGAQKGQDTCQGDSGGPLQIPHSNVYCSYIQHGITSVGLKCGGGIPGLYTKIIQYMPWIKSIIWH